MTAISCRRHDLQALTYSFVYNTASIASGVPIGSIPSGSHIVAAQTAVTTAFNAGGTDLLRIGISAGGVEIANDVDVSTTGVKAHHAFATLNPTSGPTIYVRYVGSGAAATAGAAYVTIFWKLDKTGSNSL